MSETKQVTIFYSFKPFHSFHYLSIFIYFKHALFRRRSHFMSEDIGIGIYTVDLVIFARFLFSRGGQIPEFKNLAKIIIIIALLKKNENSRIF